MDYVYKVEITIDENKAIAEGKSPQEVYEVIDRCFDEDCFFKQKNGNMITYYTMLEEKDGSFTGSVFWVYDSVARPYISSMIWYNKVLDNVEDVIKELQEEE